MTSLERAQGAAAAGNRRWTRRQTRAAGTAAADAAVALRRSRHAGARLRRAVERSELALPALTTDQVRKLQEDIAANGLSPRFARTLRAVGLSRAQRAAFARAIASADPVRLAGPVTPGDLAAPLSRRTTRRLTRELVAFDARVRHSPLRRVHPTRI